MSEKKLLGSQSELLSIRLQSLERERMIYNELVVRIKKEQKIPEEEFQYWQFTKDLKALMDTRPPEPSEPSDKIKPKLKIPSGKKKKNKIKNEVIPDKPLKTPIDLVREDKDKSEIRIPENRNRPGTFKKSKYKMRPPKMHRDKGRK